MELVIGGKSQGKLNYAIDLLNEPCINVSDGELKDAHIIYNLQNIVRKLMTEERDAISEIDNFVNLHPNCVIICDEVGYGLVPIDQFERNYRDMVGKICCNLAKKATRVHRVICGIGTVIKDA